MKTIYNKSVILKSVWRQYRNQSEQTSEVFSMLLKQAWKLAKENKVNHDLSEVYKKYRKDIHTYVKYRVNNDSLKADEITNDTFLKAGKYLCIFNSKKSNITTWLKTIANNCIYDYYKANTNDKIVHISDYVNAETGKEYYVIEAQDNSEELTDTNDFKNRIEKAFSSLKPKYRQIAELYFIKQMKYNEIAEICDISMDNVKVLINRCRKMLQTELIDLKKEMSVY